MKKKLFTLILVRTMIATSLTGCGGNSDKSTDNTTKDSTSTQKEKKELKLLELLLKAYAVSYKRKTGQEVIIESLGGGIDINGTIKGYLAAGNMPDIYVS